MKIIHVADVHLDSKLNRHLDDRKAKERRDELLLTFQRMVQYGDKEGVEAILIAGDLFDVAKISATARGAVLSVINDHPWITFYYLRGNHDADSFLRDCTDKNGKQPKNLKLFSETWTSYEQQGSDGSSVVITGAEMNAENAGQLPTTLLLDQAKLNIVMLHGQEVETAGKKDAEVIPLRELKNQGIDYLALGHIHAPKLEKLDARGSYAYSGCLEGRGFDECGPRGFYMLTVSSGRISAEFVPFAKRRIWELPVDLSETVNSDEAISVIRQATAKEGVADKDLVKVILTGEVALEAEFDEGYMAKSLEQDHYFVKVVNRTQPKVDYESYALDVTLKGEYVRRIKDAVQAGDLAETEAAEMIRLGIRLLSGEEKLA
ncbi:MAG: metallophosphoesterase family protein [Lachnospiraceae bacterium]|nr:metallophosphoesterase family protein [Lachnospiraceae bacterium]